MLQLVDVRRDIIGVNAPADIHGSMVAEGSPAIDGTLWLITRMIVETSGQQCRCDVFVVDPGTTNPLPRQLVDNTVAGDLDISEYPRGLLVLGGECVLGVWTQASAGATGLLVVQYEVYNQPAGGQSVNQYANVAATLGGGR